MKAQKIICDDAGGGSTGSDLVTSHNLMVDIGNLNKICYLTSFNTGSDFINFDITNLAVVFYGSFYAQLKTGAVLVGTNISVTITANTRFIFYNATTNAFFASDADTTAFLTAEIYLIACIRPTTVEVTFCSFAEYKINGSSYIHQGKTRANAIDYVKDQVMFGEQYSLPVCDLYKESGINLINKASFIEADQLHPNAAAYTFISQQTTDFIRKYGGFTNLTGKSIGVFGGSFSVNVASQQCKNVWVSELGVTYTDYGVSGAGFGKVGNYIDTQADSAAIHDIYVLWCSTNDATNNVAVGDNGSTTHDTQHGGMYQTMLKLLTINPSAKILILTSLKAYSAPYLYNPTAVR